METAFVRQEVIDASILSPSDLRCPGCKSNTITVTGHAKVEQREVWQDGVVTNRISMGDVQGFFDVERLDCVNCQITYWLRSPQLYQLEREALMLRQQLAELKLKTGHTGDSGGGPIVGLAN